MVRVAQGIAPFGADIAVLAYMGSVSGGLPGKPSPAEANGRGEANSETASNGHVAAPRAPPEVRPALRLALLVPFFRSFCILFLSFVRSSLDFLFLFPKPFIFRFSLSEYLVIGWDSQGRFQNFTIRVITSNP